MNFLNFSTFKLGNRIFEIIEISRIVDLFFLQFELFPTYFRYVILSLEKNLEIYFSKLDFYNPIVVRLEVITCVSVTDHLISFSFLQLLQLSRMLKNKKRQLRKFLSLRRLNSSIKC